MKHKILFTKALNSVFLVGVILTTTFFSGCSSDDNIKEESVEETGAHLNFGCYNYSDSLDPTTNVNSAWCGVRYGITEGLFKFSSEVVPEPYLCDSYEVSEDNKTWKLHIRDGVKFSNGNSVTATAVKNSIERLYQETDSAQGGTGNSNPDGYLIYDEITADDETNTVTIVCNMPTANLSGILAYPYFAIIDTSVVEEEIVGTGPYMVASENQGIGIELKKNSHYWNGEVPYETVSLIYIEDSATKAMALESGDIDLAENITTSADLERLENNENFYVSNTPGVRTGNTYFNFNNELGNETLRQAVIMAIDSKTMCEITVGGMYTEGFSQLPTSLAYNSSSLVNPYEFNKEKAIEILDEANIIDTDGDGYRELNGENIDLNYLAYSSRNLNDFAQAIGIKLEEIGIKTTVNVRDYDTILALQNAGEFDMVTSNTITVGVGDPQDYLGNWYSKNSHAYGYYNNSEYDKLFEELQNEFNDEKRVEIIAKLQQILIDDAANIVHGYYNSTMISNKALVEGAEIATIDYYWLTTNIKPNN